MAIKKTTKKTTNTIKTLTGNMGSVMPSMRYKAPIYTPSSEVNSAKSALDNVLAQKPAEYKSPYQDKIDQYTKGYLNRDKFKYDFNADELYKQYKDNYAKQAEMGMQNTMAQAATMTGGYGNSYAATAGNLAYQNEMSNLNNIIPELYNQAYGRYQDEGEEMLKKVGLLQNQEDSAYGKYQDAMANWNNDRSYYDAAYNNSRNFDYGQFSDGRAFDYQMHRDNVSDEQAARQYAYQMARDQVGDEQWQKEYELRKEAQELAAKKSAASTPTSLKKTKKQFKKAEDIKNLESDDMATEWKYVQQYFGKAYPDAIINVLKPEDFRQLVQSSPKLQKLGSYNAYLKWKLENPMESNTI